MARGSGWEPQNTGIGWLLHDSAEYMGGYQYTACGRRRPPAGEMVHPRAKDWSNASTLGVEWVGWGTRGVGGGVWGVQGRKTE